MEDPGHSEPVRLKMQIAAASAVAVAAFLLFALDWNYGFNGAVTAVGSERVLAGEIPYRDFWTMYAPGHFYVNAVLQYLFGPHLLVQVVSGSAVTAAAAGLVFLTARSLGGIAAGLICSGVFVAAFYNNEYFKYLGSYPIAALFTVLAWFLVLRYYRSRDKLALFPAGLAVGVVMVVKHDVGGYVVIAIAAGLTVDLLLSRFKDATNVPRKAWRSGLVIFGAGVLVVTLPVFAVFAFLVGDDMLRELVIFPVTDFPYSRPEVYPGLIPRALRGSTASRTIANAFRYLSFAMPFFMMLTGIYTGARAYLHNRRADAALAASFITGFLLHYNAAHVQINTHIISISLYSGMLGALFLKTLITDAGERLRPAISTGAFIVGLVWILSFAYPAAVVYEKKWTEADAVLQIRKVDGIKIPQEEVQAITEVAALVDQIVPQGEPIYVGLNRHDVMLIGDTMLYYVVDRPSATRYQELHPAVTDTAPVQQEMISDIERKGVRLVVLKTIFDDERLDTFKRDFRVNLPNVGAADLDLYLRENFVEIRRIGQYSVRVRKNADRVDRIA